MRRIARTVLTLSDRSRSGSVQALQGIQDVAGARARLPCLRATRQLLVLERDLPLAVDVDDDKVRTQVGLGRCFTRAGKPRRATSCRRPTQEALGELAALDDEVVKCLVELLVTNHELFALVGGEERCLAQQLADERTACPLGPLDEPVEVGIEREPLRVELE